MKRTLYYLGSVIISALSFKEALAVIGRYTKESPLSVLFGQCWGESIESYSFFLGKKTVPDSLCCFVSDHDSIKSISEIVTLELHPNRSQS